MSNKVKINKEADKMTLSYDMRQYLIDNIPLIILFSVAFIGCIIFCIKNIMLGLYDSVFAWARLVLILGAIGICWLVVYIQKSRYRLIIDETGFTEISLKHKNKTINYDEVIRFTYYSGVVSKGVQRNVRCVILLSKSKMPEEQRASFAIRKSRWGGAARVKSLDDIIIEASVQEARTLYRKIKSFAATYNPNSNIFSLEDK